MLRASGMIPSAIAGRLEKTISMICWVLDEHGERQATLERVRLGREFARQRARRATDKPKRFNADPDTAKSRARAVSREIIDQAVRDFAACRIDRATLMALITPERRA